MGAPSVDSTAEGDHPDDATLKKSELGVSPNPKLPTHHPVAELDTGKNVIGIYRHHWWQIWLPKDPPPPPPTGLDDASITPLASANIFSVLSFHWISPMITLGYQRPLQASDLWRMDHSREAATLSSNLDVAWARRVDQANDWNDRLANGQIKPSLSQRTEWTIKSWVGKKTYAEQELQWRTVEGKKVANLALALNEVFGWQFWIGGAFKVFGDTSQLMVPLVSKALINFGKERAYNQAHGLPPPAVGRGVAMAVGLLLLTVSMSIANHQFFWRSMNTGVLARATLTAALYKRGMKLTPRERANHPNASLINHLSTDISRIDFAAQWFHAVWTAPIQVCVCIALLLAQIGPSALAGFAVFVLLFPVQSVMMRFQLRQRMRSMKFTDSRSKLLQELLGAMRIIKYFCYEAPFLQRIGVIRRKELVGIRWILLLKSGLQAMAFSVPTLASVFAFVVYTLAGHGLDPALIFTSMALFSLLRQPLMFFPRAVSALVDAKNAVSRVTPVFLADTLEDDRTVDPNGPWAIQVVDSDFQWEEVVQQPADEKRKHRFRKDKNSPKDGAMSGAATPAVPQEPFALRNVNFSIPRGQLCAIAGPVGSGKSSLLLALIGEMKQTRGTKPIFGGAIAYSSQLAWIQNASLRENVLFGSDFDEEKYWNAIQDASLLSDLEMLPDGDLTEIGERGINLSGGQKQRVNIARALYSDADIFLLDDPLSAVDAHVGEALFNNAILSALKNRGKTVVLVTHALHFLHHVDYIYNIVDGIIVEQGTYDQLVANGIAFSKLLAEFSGRKKDEEEDDAGGPSVEAKLEVTEGEKKALLKKVDLQEVRRKLDLKNLGKALGTGKLEGRLIKAEKRTTGSLDKMIYWIYFKAGNGWYNVPSVILQCILMQAASTVNSYWLIWWEDDTFHQNAHWYMGIYAALGIAGAIFTFTMGWAMTVMGYDAAVSLHRQAVQRVFHAPMSFFDTTPLGRILGVLGKDMDTVDNFISDSFRMLALTLASALGAIILITILLHYFIVAIIGIAVGYWYFAKFYRVSAREVKRLDSNLRSLLYSHFTESLTGLSTIRAYGKVERFLRDNEYFVDLEDRALFLTCANQRWLAIRLDFMGSILIFLVGVMAACGVNGISAAQIGLALTYSVTLVQLFSFITRQSAEVENYMNAVERIVQYVKPDYIEQEAPFEIPETAPQPEWPPAGALQFNDVVMSYRSGLPPVLKGISLDIKAGEKIGVVGRTGAGKSSLMIALYRIVELTGGSIWLDGIDISTLGLQALRSKISIIPQDPLLFSGTIRSNLDPFNRFDDAKLYDALRRAHLVTAPPTADPAALLAKPDDEKGPHVSRFTLDTPVDAEGANLSVGERSLLSLARALVRDEIKVVVMDEATASVDVETDNAIQATIAKEFKAKTLLCIAHRLRTIIHYDRVLVMDNGNVAEFDTPITLFRQGGGIFRSLCEQSKISEEDILKSSEWSR